MEKFLIDDCGCGKEARERFEEEFGLRVFDARKMTENILGWEGWKNFSWESTLVVFPGNGASIVRRYINDIQPAWLVRWLWKSSVKAKRVWFPGEPPEAYVGRISPGVFVGIKDVIIIDDVVSSGETCKKIREKNESFIPGARWNAVCWVAQNSMSLKKFACVFAAEAVGPKDRRVPINSLSTLSENPHIARSYAWRNLSGQKVEAFLELIKEENYVETSDLQGKS